MSSSFPVLPNSSVQATSINSNIRSVGHMFSNADDIPFSSLSHRDGQYGDSPFISQTLGDNESFPPTLSSHSEVLSATFISHPQECEEICWGPDSIQDILNFDDVPVQNDQVEQRACYIAGENAKKTDFVEWIDQFKSVDSSNWSQLLGDNDVAVPKPKETQVSQQQQHVPSGEVNDLPNSVSTVPQTKPRMRWTPC